MVESQFTPSYASALKALLNKPLKGTFDDATAQWESLLLKLSVADVLSVSGQIISDVSQNGFCPAYLQVPLLHVRLSLVSFRGCCSQSSRFSSVH